jgi:hypothetical protein
MKTFCFLSTKGEIPPEAQKLWGHLPITVIGGSPFKGGLYHSIIPPSFVKEDGRITFSLRQCHELEKAGKIRFEEVRKGLLRGVQL